MTQFRPCIDLHQGQVKQIVGGTLDDQQTAKPNHDLTSGSVTRLIENHVAEQSADWFAEKYRDDGLTGGHVIKLGPGNDDAAREALAAYPGGLQIGGGIHLENASHWLDWGASHVIVTSWLFNDQGELDWDRLRALSAKIGKQRVVIDLSCRRTSSPADRATWHVAMDRWQTITKLAITTETLDRLSDFADEFLIHAADVEGLCQGVDQELVEQLGRWGGLPMTYAGGVASMDDFQFVDQASSSRLDVTVGSALDLFGGQGVRYADLVRWNHDPDRLPDQ